MSLFSRVKILAEAVDLNSTIVVDHCHAGTEINARQETRPIELARSVARMTCALVVMFFLFVDEVKFHPFFNRDTN